LSYPDSEKELYKKIVTIGTIDDMFKFGCIIGSKDFIKKSLEELSNK